jgi:hypothetical protein
LRNGRDLPGRAAAETCIAIVGDRTRQVAGPVADRPRLDRSADEICRHDQCEVCIPLTCATLPSVWGFVSNGCDGSRPVPGRSAGAPATFFNPLLSCQEMPSLVDQISI